MTSSTLLFSKVRHFPRTKPVSEYLRTKIAKRFSDAWKRNERFEKLHELSKAVGMSIVSVVRIKNAQETNGCVTGEKLIALFAALGYTIRCLSKDGQPLTEADLSQTLEKLREDGAFFSFIGWAS